MKKSIILNDNQVNRLQQTGTVTVVDMVKPQPFADGGEISYMPVPPCLDWEHIYKEEWKPYSWDTEEGERITQYPPYQPGSTVYVREKWVNTINKRR